MNILFDYERIPGCVNSRDLDEMNALCEKACIFEAENPNFDFDATDDEDLDQDLDCDPYTLSSNPWDQMDHLGLSWRDFY